MGKINVQGVGVLEIEGNEPNSNEIQKIKRIWDWKIATWDEKEKQVKEHRYNFGKFFQEHDKRRGTDFCKTFPELESFYRECLEIKL